MQLITTTCFYLCVLEGKVIYMLDWYVVTVCFIPASFCFVSQTIVLLLTRTTMDCVLRCPLRVIASVDVWRVSDAQNKTQAYPRINLSCIPQNRFNPCKPTRALMANTSCVNCGAFCGCFVSFIPFCLSIYM